MDDFSTDVRILFIVSFVIGFSSAKNNPTNLNCSFTIDFCSWEPVSVGNYSWKISNSSYELINGFTVPKESGGMAYLVSSEESWAELLSGKFDLDQPAQLNFDLLQTRADFGSRVPQAQLLLLANNNSETSIVWAAMHSFRWKPAKVVLEPCSDCKLLFRFRVGFDKQIAAISEIYLSEVPANGTNSSASSEISLLRLNSVRRDEKLTSNRTVNQSPSSISCQFDQHLCGWASTEKNQEVWKRVDKVEVPFLALHADDDAKDPFFAAFRGAGSNTVMNSTLRSPTFFNDRKRNLTFWHTQRGDTLDNLSFMLKITSESDQEPKTLWTFKRNAKRRWFKETVLLDVIGNVTLEFICGANSYSVCAVDGLEIEDDATIETFYSSYHSKSSSISVSFLTTFAAFLTVVTSA